MNKDKVLKNIEANIAKTGSDVTRWLDSYLVVMEFIFEKDLYLELLEYEAKRAWKKIEGK